MKTLTTIVFLALVISTSANAHGHGGHGDNLPGWAKALIIGAAVIAATRQSAPVIAQQVAPVGGCQSGPAIVVKIADNQNGRITLVTQDHSMIPVCQRGEYLLMGSLPGAVAAVRVARIRVEFVNGDVADVCVTDSYRNFAVGDQLLLVPAPRER